eukprot:Opistho-2@33950
MADSTGERMRFSVQDGGQGIEESKKALVFKPFMQVSGGARHQGVGLGLYLCSMLAEALDGSVGFESTLGVGSTFWFDLPFVPATVTEGTDDDAISISAFSAGIVDRNGVVTVDVPENDDRLLTHDTVVSDNNEKVWDTADSMELKPMMRETMVQDAVQRQQPPATLRHLVCDDGKINRVVLKRYIQSMSPTAIVDEAENGLVAVQLATDADYDFVWMDVKMPVMGGIEATKEIRKLPRHAHTPIIGVTGDVTATEVMQYHEVGMQDVFSKPVNKAIITEAMKKYQRNRIR